MHDLAHLLQESWLAVGCQSHDLVFIAVMRKPEPLGERRIKNAERVREVNAVINLNAAVPSHAPGDAGEITEAVHRNDYRFGKRRNKKGRGQMRQMMFDTMNFGFEWLARKGLLQGGHDRGRISDVAQFAEEQCRMRKMR